MDTHIKDTIANGASITALGAVLMDWTSTLTLLLVLTGVLLNFTRLYDWWVKRDKKQ